MVVVVDSRAAVFPLVMHDGGFSDTCPGRGRRSHSSNTRPGRRTAGWPASARLRARLLAGGGCARLDAPTDDESSPHAASASVMTVNAPARPTGRDGHGGCRYSSCLVSSLSFDSDTVSHRPPTPAKRAGEPATRVARSAVGGWGLTSKRLNLIQTQQTAGENGARTPLQFGQLYMTQIYDNTKIGGAARVVKDHSDIKTRNDANGGQCLAIERKQDYSCIARSIDNNPPNLPLLSHDRQSLPALMFRLESLQITGIILSF